MPKTKLAKFKDTKKKKLSPAERSQVAKDRWAKRKRDAEMEGAAAHANAIIQADINEAWSESEPKKDTPVPASQFPEQPPVTPESRMLTLHDLPVTGTIGVPAPQLTPAAPKKQKRYTGPKEFSVALKAAEGRLAKAIVERAEAAGKMAMLQAEIPSLVQIINALKGPQYISAAPYDLSVQNTAFPYPSVPQFQPYVDPLDVLNAAQPAPPISRASGGAVQFSPEMVGTLEGPEDDPDQFIAGPNAGGGWIGG